MKTGLSLSQDIFNRLVVGFTGGFSIISQQPFVETIDVKINQLSVGLAMGYFTCGGQFVEITSGYPCVVTGLVKSEYLF